ncbi:hypothetical protein TVAG_259590 [Trichomonas vaginalis G3]|uniref:Uncharacterized protein n=1 Tax=Trichomonas vaginalis (strain ATCC PRA-98 / G3) TaxID=412133 RepID=A2GI69_TRIV3|nr:hypothetical protein TVAGG3_0351380 [Trichomonas vaginalis G3]EAX83148.1 hypothetical protein TVAG_259590 [Trichomonas vaginalis G3]KAI5531313.1 hypothetical protein TVAGG3_0351380 [Trichomonas vaginalis G3]|eukprot:XP_001296078.1 hypothetical protein [Trichomonas vaginalis G3]
MQQPLNPQQPQVVYAYPAPQYFVPAPNPYTPNEQQPQAIYLIPAPIDPQTQQVYAYQPQPTTNVLQPQADIEPLPVETDVQQQRVIEHNERCIDILLGLVAVFFPLIGLICACFIWSQNKKRGKILLSCAIASIAFSLFICIAASIFSY